MASNHKSRAWIISSVFILLAVILIARLYKMQVIDIKYKVLSQDQSITKRIIYPPRGIILDRNGHTLVNNTLTYDLMVTPANIHDLDTTFFCQLMGMTTKQFAKKMKQIIIRHGYIRNSVFKPYLTKGENARIQENIYRFPGFKIRSHYLRNYPVDMAAHVLGYIHGISKSMLKKPRYSSYHQGDYVGLSGLESSYEEELRGRRGIKYLVRDVLNRPRHSYKNGALDTPAIAGQTLRLYLDAELQKFGQSLMHHKIGAIVAIDPKTGGILAMVSAPSYNPALLSGKDFSSNYSKLFMQYTRPLFNNATQGQYPPGSSFKPTEATLALALGVITPQWGIKCVGGYYGCGKKIGCTEHWLGHSSDLKKAITWSCNSYFCAVFRKIVDDKKFGGVRSGLQHWHDILGTFGLGHPIGVDIPGEYSGMIPDSAYYDRLYGENWNSCNMVTNGIGQGEVAETPLQMANVTALIANRGYYYIPHFVKSIGGNPKDTVLSKYLVKHDLHIPNSIFDDVIAGMRGVVTTGTGRYVQIPGIKMCGKTGTAENYGIIDGNRVKLDNHSIFIAFAPMDNPKIAVATVVQNAGYGATWAAPISSLMIEKYLNGFINRPALLKRIRHGNTIKSYVRVIDSIQRAKDRLRYKLRTASIHFKDSVRKKRDTILVKQILQNYYNIKTPQLSSLKDEK